MFSLLLKELIFEFYLFSLWVIRRSWHIDKMHKTKINSYNISTFKHRKTRRCERHMNKTSEDLEIINRFRVLKLRCMFYVSFMTVLFAVSLNIRTIYLSCYGSSKRKGIEVTTMLSAPDILHAPRYKYAATQAYEYFRQNLRSVVLRFRCMSCILWLICTIFY